MTTRLWQQLEGGLVFAAALTLALFLDGGFVWWAAVLIFFAPDLSFGAYAAGPRIGAFVYNLVHIYAFGAVIFAAGIVFAQPALIAVGALWLGHSGFDRMMGYGLKLPEGFEHTHLGPIGSAAKNR
ncbi:DUF4260 family protein [Salipiger sp. IMCC34102]|uniref:DUF4260 domain-containing protein n=1 Tax=Salipiger sp. IMCC34102 TaxID=2510647 RepID=UPI00101B6131|nr:DUF4260 domain-containing protein [Salipiger sp. IMCC34102]RYH02207.1 DUF4260 family protein [Salipiger sp. IMCC34102]